MKHTILGAGGAIGNALAVKLLENYQDVKLVSRSRYSIPGATAVKEDITSYKDMLGSIGDSDIVYLCAGLKYDYNVWKELWPKVMSNAINACKISGAKLIFFDNVYMYGLVNGKMTETTPYNPCSRKGEIRAQIARMLEDEMSAGNITAMIVRSADFYGPYARRNSPPNFMVIEKLLNGKGAQWFGDGDKPHSITYTLDCANALFLLANSPESYGQVWHLPTCNPPLTGKEFIRLAAEEIGVKAKYSVISKSMFKFIGLFNRTIHEVVEMLYQNTNEYYFDSTKFEQHFNYKPTTYLEGIKATIEYYKKS